MPDWIINLIFFLLGLTISVLGIIQNHHYYLRQQQEKFDHISDSLSNIAQRIAVLEMAINEQRIEQLTLTRVGKESDRDNAYPLTRRERMILKLVYGDGLNHQEAAERMGIQTSSLRSHIASLIAKGAIQRGRNVTEYGQRILEEIRREAETQDDEGQHPAPPQGATS